MGNDEKKALIARYTELDPLDLADGAFDEALFTSKLLKKSEKSVLKSAQGCQIHRQWSYPTLGHAVTQMSCKTKVTEEEQTE